MTTFGNKGEEVIETLFDMLVYFPTFPLFPPISSSDAKQVKHYDIKQDKRQYYYILPAKHFSTIAALIEYYKLNCEGIHVLPYTHT